MISKSQIKKRIKKKTNPILVKTIELAKRNNHLELAKKLLIPTRKQGRINLNELNNIEENKVIVPGKVLGEGEINKKISVFALSFSEQAKEKLKKAGCEFKTINEEIKNNPELKGIRVI